MKVIRNQTMSVEDVHAGTLIYEPVTNFYYLVTDENTDKSVTCVNVYTGQLVQMERSCRVQCYPNGSVTAV